MSLVRLIVGVKLMRFMRQYILILTADLVPQRDSQNQVRKIGI